MNAIILVIVVWALISSFNKAAKEKARPRKNPIAQALEIGGQPAPGHPYAPPQAAAPSPGGSPQPEKAEPRKAREPLKAEPRKAGEPLKARLQEMGMPQAPSVSPEGQDPCHGEMFRRPERVALAQEASEAPQKEAPALSFTQESMAQAVVMQEILTRPCQRRRRLGC